MATAVLNTTSSPLVSLAAVWDALKQRRELAREYRATFQELDQLSDRELADIGVARWEIPTLVSKHVYGR